MKRFITRPRGLLLLLAALGGCASVPREAGFDEVRKLTSERIEQRVQWNRNGEDDQATAAAVAALLAQPLEKDAAVQIALLNNRALQARFEDLGVAQSDLVQAGLLANPVFAASHARNGDVSKTVLGVEFNFLNLLLLPLQQTMETARFEHTKFQVAQEIIKLSTEVKKAWVAAVAAEQTVEMYQSVVAGAEAQAQLAARQFAAGAISHRERNKLQAFHAESLTQIARAQNQQLTEREKLNRLLGLTGQQTQWTLPGRLPETLFDPPALNQLEKLALDQRLDLRAAQRETAAFGEALGITRGSRFVNLLNIGFEREKTTGERTLAGPSVQFELPLFDQGQARLARHESLYRQSEQRLAQLAVDVRSEVRESHHLLLSAREQAAHQRSVILPLRQEILEQTQRYYNGMLDGVYSLLADAREQVLAGQAFVEALKNYWVAHAELERALGGRLPAAMPSAITPSGNAIAPPAKPVSAPAAPVHAH